MEIHNVKKDLAMYILVDKDLEINKGKLAGQVGHAVSSYFYHCKDKELLDDYMYGMQKKIILACPRQRLIELIDQEIGIPIRDAGLTELEPETLTCINLGIFDRNDENNSMPKWVKRLRLYK